MVARKNHILGVKYTDGLFLRLSAKPQLSPLQLVSNALAVVLAAAVGAHNVGGKGAEY